MNNIFTKLKNFRERERFSVGIDIGSHTIKVAKLKFAQDQVELCAFDLMDSRPDTLEPLKKIKQDFAPDLVNISFSGSATVVRYVNFLKMDIGELNQALKYEAQKHIPFSLAEVNMDAVILKDDLADNKMLVLLAAIKKDALSQRLKVMDAAGLKAGLIDLDSIALVNVFNFNHPKGNSPAGESQNHKCIGLLNIGASLSNISIIDQGIPRFSRDIHIGGNNFTKKIMDVLNIDFKEAESIKINPAQGVDQRNKVKASVESVLGNLAAEIRTSFDYYESQNTSSVAKIFLSGGSSRFGALKEMLTTLLGIEVECWDPFAQIIKTDKIDTEKLAGQAFEFNVAVGLALR